MLMKNSKLTYLIFKYFYKDVSVNWSGVPNQVEQPEVKINTEKTLLGYGKPVKGNENVTARDQTYKQVPEKIPPIYDGSQLLVFRIFGPGEMPTGVNITAESPDGPLSIQVEVR